jgi:dihydropteroate synthase
MPRVEDILRSHLSRQPVVMGILNVTPDSFSDGGSYASPADAIEHARAMVTQGADVIDVGAESTRPGSRRIGAREQLDRLAPVLPGVTALGVPVSIDTTLSDVARFGLECGCSIINDVSAGRDDAGMLALAASSRAPIVLMHMLGEPATMQRDPQYVDVVQDVRAFLVERTAAAMAAGVAKERIIVDPGIGFGKRTEHNLALLGGIGAIAQLGMPVLVGPSRKRFIGDLTGQSAPADRAGGTIGACVAAYLAGASIFRVHDVAVVRQALDVARAIASAGRPA